MSRMPANTSLNTLAPRIASPVTIPRYSVVARPSTDGVVVTIIPRAYEPHPAPLRGPLIVVVHPITSSRHDERAAPAQTNRPVTVDRYCRPPPAAGPDAVLLSLYLRAIEVERG